jgi:hypothetical protein
LPENGVFAGFSLHPPSKGCLRAASLKQGKIGFGLKTGVSFDGSPLRGAFLPKICTPAIFGAFSRQKIEIGHKKQPAPQSRLP